MLIQLIKQERESKKKLMKRDDGEEEEEDEELEEEKELHKYTSLSNYSKRQRTNERGGDY
jgi:hypothetical protein